MRSDMIKKGAERAPHRSLLKATGVTDADMDKPFIAVCNSHVDIIPGHVHLQQVGNFIRDRVREAGGVPFVFNTIGVDDGIAMGHTGMKYSLPSRELIADCVETMLQAHCFDGMICITNCDKIVPGMMMAAARCNVPTIVVSGGPMETGRTPSGKTVDLINVFYAVAEHNRGQITDDQLEEIENYGCPTCGSCSGMFTANSMNCLAEALGIALPGNGTILATSEDRRELYAAAARRIVELVKADLKPRDIMTLQAFDNAMILDMAMGGSSNTLLHVLAIAREADVQYDMARINDLSMRVPNICRVAPSPGDNGRVYHVEDVHAAGGIMTILGELVRAKPGLLKTDCMTVTGRALGESIAEHDNRARGERLRLYGQSTGNRSSLSSYTDRAGAGGVATLAAIEQNTFDPYDCIRTVETAYSPEGGLAILYGNLAPDGSVVKTAGVSRQHREKPFEGPANIFESQEEACEGILGRKVKPGDVVVIRNEGPRGGPGMQEMLAPTSYIKGMGLGESCWLITDGRFSGGTAGNSIAHVSPEAVVGGPIGLLGQGDVIRIDLPNRRLEVNLSDVELRRRREQFKPLKRELTGYLSKYASMASSAATGAVLRWDR